MQGSSRAAAAASRDAFVSALTSADPSRLAEELFAVVDLVDGSATLRRALADPSREGSEKGALAERLLAGKISGPAVSVVQAVASQRWSSDRDLTDTIEQYAIEALVATAETAGSADRLEDELFRFERIVAADPALRSALAETKASPEARSELVSSLLAGKASEQTQALAQRAVAAPRGRRFDRTVERFLDVAATRRQQQTATITSASPLTEADRTQLAASLAAIYGGAVHLNAVVDPRVMGGIRVEIGDEVIDGTVLHKLEAARRAMGA